MDEPWAPPVFSCRGVEARGEHRDARPLFCSCSEALLLGDPCPEQPHFPMDAPSAGIRGGTGSNPDPEWVVAASSAPSTSSWRPCPHKQLQRAAPEAQLHPSHPTGIQPHPSLLQNSEPPAAADLCLHAKIPPFSLLGSCPGPFQRVQKLGSARGAQQQQQGPAGARGAEPGIDFPLIPCNHILQRLLSYISIPHLRL